MGLYLVADVGLPQEHIWMLQHMPRGSKRLTSIYCNIEAVSESSFTSNVSLAYVQKLLDSD